MNVDVPNVVLMTSDLVIRELIIEACDPIESTLNFISFFVLFFLTSPVFSSYYCNVSTSLHVCGVAFYSP